MHSLPSSIRLKALCSALGGLRKRVTVVDDQIAVRTMLVLSLTFDHRLVDGAPAARFLQRLKDLLERPYLWLARWS